MGGTSTRRSLKTAETRARRGGGGGGDELEAGGKTGAKGGKGGVRSSGSRRTSTKAREIGTTARKRKVPPPDDGEDEEEEEEEEEEDDDAYVGSDAEPESDLESLHSDALDEDTPPSSSKTTKRKRSSQGSPKKNGGTSPQKRRKTRKSKDEEEEDSAYEVDLEEGQEVVGVVVQAPKTGRVPPGQISTNTLAFLRDLKKPECNDREWFKLHEPIFRQAEQEFKLFLEAFTDVLVDADEQIPHLPPKDVMHRIYRDIRFSNDKTPYKTGFSASFSRSGRKGIFAGLKPNNESLIAAGIWHPSTPSLTTLRSNLLRSPRFARRLRSILSSAEFVALFGEASPHPRGERRSVWGMEDELKVAPKGVDKNHPDIDLLKCRSFAVVHKFTDEQVLDPGFKEELGRVARVMRPFVHCINDLMTIQEVGSDDEDEDGDGDGDGGEGEGEGEGGDGEGGGEEDDE